MTSNNRNNGDMTAIKAQAQELLALGQHTQADIAKMIGTSPQSICAWKKDPIFMKGVVDRAREILREAIPEVYKALTDKSKEGRDKHIKIFLEHIEKLEEARSSQVNITFTWRKPDTDES